MLAAHLELKTYVPDGAFGAFIARPVQAAPAPVVIVLQEIFGVNADLRETCRELASAGFIAVAPDLFWRDAPGLDLNAWSEAEWARGLALYQAYDVDRGVRDIAAVVDMARAIPGATGKVGVMGFCLGGLMTYLTAARVRIDAAAAFYGGGIDQHLEEADAIKAPFILHLGDQDEFIPAPAQAAIQSRLKGRVETSVYLYPGCSHAFARHTGAHYDADAARLAFGRTLDHFAWSLLS
jgi:carboxymethylenebutenolidase